MSGVRWVNNDSGRIRSHVITTRPNRERPDERGYGRRTLCNQWFPGEPEETPTAQPCLRCIKSLDSIRVQAASVGLLG